MPANQEQTSFKLAPGVYGDRLLFKTPDELQQWGFEESKKWEWLAGQDASAAWSLNTSHTQFYTQVKQAANNWRQLQPQPRPENRRAVFDQMASLFQQFYVQGTILNSTSVAASFLFKLKDKSGVRTAAGAYASLQNAPFQAGGPLWAASLEGVVEAFLFKREIDWAAAAHQEALNRCKKQYEEEMALQERQFKALEEQNRQLNDQFGASLKTKSDSLQKLHDSQAEDFAQLISKHVQELTALEKIYDQKLALQKPVKYWQTKEAYHTERAKNLAKIGVLAGISMGAIIAWLVNWVFANLPPDKDPKHWQLGVLLIAAFFSVWLVRIIVRLFFGHLHLATDAAERRTMILTYLAMSREGAQFGADDKKLIIQHLFRSTSDGFVKDDASPPGLLEFFTRK